MCALMPSKSRICFRFLSYSFSSCLQSFHFLLDFKLKKELKQLMSKRKWKSLYIFIHDYTIRSMPSSPCQCCHGFAVSLTSQKKNWINAHYSCMTGRHNHGQRSTRFIKIQRKAARILEGNDNINYSHDYESCHNSFKFTHPVQLKEQRLTPELF